MVEKQKRRVSRRCINNESDKQSWSESERRHAFVKFVLMLATTGSNMNPFSHFQQSVDVTIWYDENEMLKMESATNYEKISF